MLVMLAAAIPLMAAEPLHDPGNTDLQAVLQLGQRVQAVGEAIQHPGEPGSLAAIIELGSDQRYYVMVRGWLYWQLQGDLSILSASGDQPRDHVRTRIELIKEAIRRIDLE